MKYETSKYCTYIRNVYNKLYILLYMKKYFTTLTIKVYLIHIIMVIKKIKRYI